MKILRPVLTAAILWIATLPTLGGDSTPRTESHRDGTPLVSPLAAQPLERMSNTRDRPLFSPTRRPPAPPPVVAMAPLPPPPPPDVALLGVVMDGEDARAVVRTGPAAKTLRVGIGDDIGGWKVGQIEARQLVLLLDGRTATFTMFTGTSTKPPSNTGAAQPPPVAPPQSIGQQPQAAADEPVPASRRHAH